MTEPTPAPIHAAHYTTEDGFERYFATAVLDRHLFQQLEDYRLERQISRSDAIRRIISHHLSRQLNTTTTSP